MGEHKILSDVEMKKPESKIFLIPIVSLMLLVLFFPFHVVNWVFSDDTDYEGFRDVLEYSWTMKFVYTTLFFDRVLCVELWDRGDTPPDHMSKSRDNVEDQNGRYSSGIGLFHAHNQHYPPCLFKLDLTSYDQT